MKATRISRGRKIAILALSVICICVCGFLIWLSKYSSIYPLGEAKPTGYSHPIWSPDGTYIALYCGFSYPTDGWDEASFNDPTWDVHTKDVCIVDLKTKQLKRITHGRYKWDLIMSPDGSMLSWWDGQKGALVVYDVMSQKTLAKVKTVDGLDEQFWSLDGRRIVSYCGNVALDINSKEVTPSPSMFSSYVALSPNEKYLAFTQQVRPDGTELEIIETEDGECDWPGDWSQYDEILIIMENEKIIFTSKFNVSGWSFAWSPDGSLLLAEKETDELGDSEIAIINVATGEVISFTAKYVGRKWYWSPGGSKIAFATYNGIHVVDLEFGQNPFSHSNIKERTFETEVDQNHEWLSWSPDEKRIAFVDYLKIWILNLETGEIEPLLPDN